MRRILVVDDDPRTRAAIGLWLKHCGFRVAITDRGASGPAALEDGTFDLMIIDVLMPNMRGFEVVRILHRHAPTVPLIAIAGYAFSPADADDPACFKLVRRLGATRCPRKPFRPATLLGVTTSVCRRRNRTGDMRQPGGHRARRPTFRRRGQMRAELPESVGRVRR